MDTTFSRLLIACAALTSAQVSAQTGPPQLIGAASGPSTAAARVNTPNALNPQPLPSQGMAPRPGTPNTLNPQPLPPQHITRIASIRDARHLPDSASVSIHGKIFELGQLRKSAQLKKPTITPQSYTHKFDATERIRDVREITKPIKWITHDLPKERWQLMGCGNAEGDDRYKRNHCNGSDPTNAANDRDCVDRLLADGMGVVLSFTGQGRGRCDHGNGGTRAGGFHSSWSSDGERRTSGRDVFDIYINPECKFEQTWTQSSSDTVIDTMVPRRGMYRAIARWQTNSCTALRVNYFVTSDTDYACFTGYYNTKTTATCPEGVVP